MKHAVYSGTRNLYRDMATSAKSLIANSSVDRVHFLIEDDEFDEELPDVIDVQNVNGWSNRFDGPNISRSIIIIFTINTLDSTTVSTFSVVISTATATTSSSNQ